MVGDYSPGLKSHWLFSLFDTSCNPQSTRRNRHRFNAERAHEGSSGLQIGKPASLRSVQAANPSLGRTPGSVRPADRRLRPGPARPTLPTQPPTCLDESAVTPRMRPPSLEKKGALEAAGPPSWFCRKSPGRAVSVLSTMSLIAASRHGYFALSLRASVVTSGVLNKKSLFALRRYEHDGFPGETARGRTSLRRRAAFSKDTITQVAVERVLLNILVFSRLSQVVG